jgi:hypothetical protein
MKQAIPWKVIFSSTEAYISNGKKSTHRGKSPVTRKTLAQYGFCSIVTTHARLTKNRKKKGKIKLVNRVCSDFFFTFAGLWQQPHWYSARLFGFSFHVCAFFSARSPGWSGDPISSPPDFLSPSLFVPRPVAEKRETDFVFALSQTEARNRYVMESAERPSVVFRLNSASVCFGNGQPALCMHTYTYIHPLTHTCI